MGGSASSQTASGDIKNDEKSNDMSNYGLINLSSESLTSSPLNLVEVATFLLIFIGAAYCLRIYCQKRWQKGYKLSSQTRKSELDT